MCRRPGACAPAMPAVPRGRARMPAGAVPAVAVPAVAVPAGFPHAAVCAPWWVVEVRARADNHTREPHVHLDHVFLALAAGGDPTGVAAHETRWFSELEIGRAGGISEDSRLQATDLFPRVMRMAAALTWARFPGREAPVSGRGCGPGLDAGA